MLALRRLVPVSRSLHTTSVLRKAKAPTEEDELELSDDLFVDGASTTESPSSSKHRILREKLSQEIFRRTPDLRVGTLRKVIQLSETPEDLEGLDRVLREWRLMGMRVTRKTGEELVGRCINLGRPDLAKTYTSDRLQFGIDPVHRVQQARLEKALGNVE